MAEIRREIVNITRIGNVVSVNLDRSTWEKQFDRAIKQHGAPERSIWPDYMSEKADKNWTWH